MEKTCCRSLNIRRDILVKILNTDTYHLSVEYFIAIAPPKEYGEIITQFQRRWPNNALPYFVEPHITVKSQAGLNEDGYWIDSIKTICSNFAIFTLSLKGVKSFGKSVVYLGVESDRIQVLHRKIVEAISPNPENSRRYYELDLYDPHLTLGSKEFGICFLGIFICEYDSDLPFNHYFNTNLLLLYLLTSFGFHTQIILP